MSGGGQDVQYDANGNKVGDPATPAPATPAPGIAGATGTTTMQPFMPGFDQAIANQMGQGFGGKPDDYLAAFKQIFQPMTVPTWQQAKSSSGTWKDGEWIDTRVPGDDGKKKTTTTPTTPRNGNVGAGRTGGRNS